MTLVDCGHLAPGPYPFDEELVLDNYFGMTDAVVRCQHCHQRYLLSLLDWELPSLRKRTFAVRQVDDAAFERFAHDITRDYCDLTRKQAEADALEAASPLLDVVLRLDVHERRLLGLEPRARDTPTRPWRERLV